MEYTSYWLPYHRLSEENKSDLILFKDTEGEIIENAIKELSVGFQALYGRNLQLVSHKDNSKIARSSIYLRLDIKLPMIKDGYVISCTEGICTISACSSVGILYGAFALLRNLQLQGIRNYDTWTYSEEKAPSNPLRMLNHWDNMDGSIERGYSGESFFFLDQNIVINDRTREYARMIASIGINALTVNNVNVKGAATYLISDRYYDELRQLMKLFSGFGVKLFLSVNFAAPMELGELHTADPCEDKVISWWEGKAREIWDNLPEFGGFLVKADSEGRPGPFTYGRTHAQGANMLAEAIRPYSGIIIWRCFVYNCQQDWRDQKTDRARSGYDHFMPFDGEFLENVILQIKNGPMDFQVREPVTTGAPTTERITKQLEWTGQRGELGIVLNIPNRCLLSTRAAIPVRRN